MSRHAVATGSGVRLFSRIPFRSPTCCSERTQQAYSAWLLGKTVLSSLSCPDTFTEIYDARSVMRDQK